ncbi:hypothetical protein NP233_g10479 [Leucocoprinus birnbaumii]|uniref:Nucleotidyltransferase family protein n=1 Tax=Leucocoprinus birnbaumii TaxID=56174 RepID=A0AAD5VIP7_9AGAR|nr:hypothetical protein NP233_g10479 [Leucocoprinus birnbaumii]
MVFKKVNRQCCLARTLLLTLDVYQGVRVATGGEGTSDAAEPRLSGIEEHQETISVAQKNTSPKRGAPAFGVTTRKKAKTMMESSAFQVVCTAKTPLTSVFLLTILEVMNLLCLDDDALVCILSELRAPDLYAFSQTHSRAKELCGTALHGQVLSVLSQFVNGQELLDLLQATGAVISGSLVLQLFSGPPFIPNDLDIYVPQENAGAIAEFVTGKGYELSSRRMFDEWDYNIHLATESLHYSRKCMDGSVVDINVIATRAVNPIASVVDFDCTWVMNVITSRGLIALYHQWTALQTGLMNRRMPSGERIVKYAKRGYFAGHPYNAKLRKCITEVRSLHDEHSMYLAFKPTEAEYWYCDEEERFHEVWFDAKKERLYWALQAPVAMRYKPPFIFEAAGKNGLIGNRPF